MLKPVGQVLCLCAVALAGCAQPSHLIAVHRTTIGLSMAGSSEGSGHFSLGYRQREVFVVPKTNLAQPGEQPRYEAMSVMSCTTVEATFLGPVDFRQTLASGDAATQYAQKYAAGEVKGALQPFRCFAPSAPK